MKHLLLFGFLLFFFSCKKNETTTQDTFKINGVQDVTAFRGETKMIAVLVEHTGGTQPTVALSLEGLPAKVTASLEPASGTASFTSVIKIIVAAECAEGTYPVKLLAKAGAQTKEYTFNLKVQRPEGCAIDLIGSYSGTDTCGNTPVTTTISLDPLFSDKVVISQLPYYTGAVSASIVCLPDEIMILCDRQNNGPSSILATGSFKNGQLIIDYTLSVATGPGFFQSCRITLQK